MCLGTPSIAAPQQVQATPPPPAPVQNAKPPILASQVNQQATQADLKRKGTQIFRNDLAIPSGGSSGGNGLNIPN